MIYKIFILLVCCICLQTQSHSETYRNLNLFSQVFHYIRNQSARPVSDEKLIETALNGMLSSLDEYSMYITPEKYEEILNNLRGEFGGIGIEFTLLNGKIVVISPIDDSPAFEAGIMAGDELLQIDDTSVQTFSLAEIRDKIKGQVGEPLSLKIRRKNKIFNVTLRRSKINLKALKWSFSKGILCVRISHFNEKISDQLRILLRKHKNLKGVLLDLRNNPGGILEEALDVVNIFLSKGIIISIKSQNPKNNKVYYAHGKKVLYPKTPLVILMNEGTASSAEIVAAALGDHKRATLVGEKSFGKGSVQTILPIPPGYSAIQLTTGFYYTPSNNSLDKQGIKPHILFEGSPTAPQKPDLMKQKGIQLLLREKIS